MIIVNTNDNRNTLYSRTKRNNLHLEAYLDDDSLIAIRKVIDYTIDLYGKVPAAFRMWDSIRTSNNIAMSLYFGFVRNMDDIIDILKKY